MKRSKKNPKFDDLIKVEVERFGDNYLLRNFKFLKGVIKIAIDFFMKEQDEFKVLKNVIITETFSVNF